MVIGADMLEDLPTWREADQVLAVIEPSVAGAQSVQLLVNQAQLRTLDAELAAKRVVEPLARELGYDL